MKYKLILIISLGQVEIKIEESEWSLTQANNKLNIT